MADFGMGVNSTAVDSTDGTEEIYDARQAVWAKHADRRVSLVGLHTDPATCRCADEERTSHGADQKASFKPHSGVEELFCPPQVL